MESRFGSMGFVTSNALDNFASIPRVFQGGPRFDILGLQGSFWRIRHKKYTDLPSRPIVFSGASTQGVIPYSTKDSTKAILVDLCSGSHFLDLALVKDCSDPIDALFRHNVQMKHRRYEDFKKHAEVDILQYNLNNRGACQSASSQRKNLH